MQKTKTELYMQDLIKNIIEIESNTKKKLNKNKISELKNKIAKKHKITKIPRDMDLMLLANKKQIEKLKHLKSKPTRSESGVAVVAVMTKPHKCPHGKCRFCPGGIKSNYGDTPQSYTGLEPSTRRAIRNNYDSFLIVFNRLMQYVLGGHNPNKVDCIIMGGTFPSYDYSYQLEVVIKIYAAMNAFSEIFYKNEKIDITKFKEFFELPHEPNDPEISPRVEKRMQIFAKEYLEKIKDFSEKTLEKVKEKNETSAIRCIGLTQETRPDCCSISQIKRMLKLGTTRVELGVQSVFENILKKSERGHSVKDTIIATENLKNFGFKVNYHMMLNLPGSDIKKDIENFKILFSDDNYKPDMLKIYPLLVMKGTKLHEDFLKNKYKPYQFKDIVKAIAEIMKIIPNYCRVMRIQRDIPSNEIVAGINKTNLKQYIESYMKDKKIEAKEIRSREVSRKKINAKIKFKLNVYKYNASKGKEFFICYEDKENDVLAGFCRLRFIDKILSSEFTKNSAIIRELHVYGSALNIGQKKGSYADSSVQHKGIGKKLIKKAEDICIKNKKNKLLVISGVGVKEYYKKQGYIKDGFYVSKELI